MNKETKRAFLEAIKSSEEDTLNKKVKSVAKSMGIPYSKNLYKNASKWLRGINVRGEYESNEGHSGVYSVADKVGIPRDSISHYWFKGQNYSIFSKSDKPAINWDDIADTIEDRVASHSPNYKRFERVVSNDPTLLVIDCADIHIGKLATVYTSGDDYNIEKAKRQVLEGVRGIMSKAANFNISKILFVIGNDIIHTDTPKSTTTSGTFQDSSDMLTNMFNQALDMYVTIIDSLMVDYDIDVVHNSSNHDYMTGWMLARCIDAWYRNSPNVNVDSGIIHRKYYQFGTNMICTSHGDGCKMQDLPLLMANEAPQMWANTKYRYAYLHHIHHKQVTKFQSGKDYIGVTVEYLRSPSPADRWHHDNGYVGAKKAVEGFIHSYEHGQISRITHYF